jgi:hypothetical protein
LDITFDDLDLDYFAEDGGNARKSTASKMLPDRPQSAMSHSSNYTLATTAGGQQNRKSTFHLFKNNRNSFSGDVPPRASSPIPTNSVYDPDGGNTGGTTMNFDDLIKSGGTVKVSLTPNRLRSIEIKDTKKDELSVPTWERRSTSASPRLLASGTSHSLPNVSGSTRPSSPLVRQNTSNSVRSNNSNKKLSSHQEEQEHPLTIEVPKINTRPNTPSSPLGKKSFSTTVSEKSRFENPRDAPKPPVAVTPLSPTISVASINTTTSSLNNKLTPILNKTGSNSPILSTSASQQSITPAAPLPKAATPLPKLSTSAVSYVTPTTTAKSAIPSTHSSDSISSEISSVPSIPSPITSTPPPPSDTLSIKSSSTISIVEPPIPRPTKSIPLNGMVIRRSSVSNKKSRDNLRRTKEEQQLKASPLNDEPVPAALNKVEDVIEDLGVKQVEKEEEPVVVLTEEPTQMEAIPASRQVRFDNAEETATVDSPIAITNNNDEQSTNETAAETTSPTTAEEQEESPSTTGEAAVDTIIPRIKKAATLSPERPSSMVAKRASMVGNNRRRSLHENYAAEKYHQDVLLRQRVSTVGSVSVSIKQWDDILKPEEQITVIPPAAHRRSVLRQLRQQQLQEQLQLQQELVKEEGDAGAESSATGAESSATGVESSATGAATTNGVYLNGAATNNSNAVLDKVLKFERASSLDDVAHQRVSHMPRRERFLYLQQDPSAIERKSTIATTPKKVIPSIRRPVGIDQGIQTDPEPVVEKKEKSVVVSTAGDKSEEEQDSDNEEGEVDGDEEWFLQDDEWDEQEETAIVEWLLGE